MIFSSALFLTPFGRRNLNERRSIVCTSGSAVRQHPSTHVLVNDPGETNHSISSCEAALIRISGLPLYNSIRPVIFTRLLSMPVSSGDLLTGDAGGIQPVNVWLG